ncbi:hypothetical protein [Mucisphaera calidilacus]|uniref:Uncharacterized protein n=1 Tax=Mucisphaera calidilacus TaxID=2527982 RepID=A0A518BU98_9BACT|nr:hypothetical protein [Mucisphaera calidilacus]QDU70536.1 hypothetical protein Pan265_03640 [Mucisphaera calidilacus]
MISVDDLQYSDRDCLIGTRLQVHWALQAISAAADARLEHAEDDSHSNLGYDHALHGLAGRQLPDGSAFALRFTDAVFMRIQSDGSPGELLPLDECSLEDLLSWVNQRLPGSGPDIRLRDYDMPSHPVADGSSFELSNAEALSRIDAWCALGHACLTRALSERPDAGPIRLWPHHLDFGGIVLLNAGDNPAMDPSIGLGLSLGDATYSQPYFYVNPYGLESRPDTLPLLPVDGFWTEEWMGAVLLGESLFIYGVEAASAFLEETIRASRALLVNRD